MPFLIRVRFLIIALAVAGTTAHAASKPFMHQVIASDVAEDVGNRLQQQCFLRRALSAHIDFVVSKVLPRGTSEIAELLQPQSIGDKTFHVAFGTDFADLYHFHVRYPNRFSFTDVNAFTNSADYHLQYHSFEHFDLMKTQWLQSLHELNDPQSQVWVEERLKKALARPEFSSAIGRPSIEKPLSPLTPAGLERLAGLWDRRLGAQSPGTASLMLRLTVLNDLIAGISATTELMKWRSVASHDGGFEVLRGLDLPNVWQPVDLFFAKVEDNPQVAEEIRRYTERTGQTWLGNYESGFAFQPPSTAIAEDAKATFQKNSSACRSRRRPVKHL